MYVYYNPVHKRQSCCVPARMTWLLLNIKELVLLLLLLLLLLEQATKEHRGSRDITLLFP